ncbi:MAG: hypothetical protein GC187_03610 [Alphaproteobacteria bacterium]|nr:hypothetical protein [Alphaproteobacteria bacterium]
MTPENSARLFGAIDSLLDMENALRGLWGKIGRGETPTQLECLGFLSALYIQQDCVKEVYRALNRTGFVFTSEL